ncbi:MAG: helix-turn-helix domain-containing protein [Myxococcales bacterium]|nr:helix-turn-helix domain-containing protein [Myxococcales bacterium]
MARYPSPEVTSTSARVEPPPSTPQALSVEEAARRLGISRSTAYECVRNGSIPSLRFRRRIVIPAVVIDQLLGSVVVDADRSIPAAS